MSTICPNAGACLPLIPEAIMTTNQARPGRQQAPRFEVVALTDHEWRVCDPTIDTHDGRRVLGFIARREGAYEVLALAPAPVPRGSYRDWDTALQALTRRNYSMRRAWGSSPVGRSAAA